MTFGVISENTRIANVMATVPSASASSPSPNSRCATTAVSVAAPALIRLLQRLAAIIAVSASENSPDSTSSTASAKRSEEVAISGIRHQVSEDRYQCRGDSGGGALASGIRQTRQSNRFDARPPETRTLLIPDL
jgi:hypothetical protein